MALVTVDVDVEIDEFDDHEIIEAATDVLRRIAQGKKPNSLLTKAINELREAFMSREMGLVESDLSTAARLSDLGSLRALVEGNPTLYRFARATGEQG